MVSQSIIRELKSVDWNFPRVSDEPFRSQHWYPGTFPPELPSTLIQATTGPDDLVFDPYGGIGTTSTEALRLGRRAWLVELNRVAALAAYVSGASLLLKRHHPELLDGLLSSLATIIARLQKGSLFNGTSSPVRGNTIDDIWASLVEPSPQEFLSQLVFAPTPDVGLLEPWYHQNTLRRICEFKESLADEGSVSLQLIGLMGLSACLKALSSQTRSWGHIADNVRPKEVVDKDVSISLRRWFGRFAGSIRRAHITQSGGDEIGAARQLCVSIHDWRQGTSMGLAPSEGASVLITSPPYGGAIDYILSQRLSYYLLGAKDDDLLYEQRKEIGARRRRFSDKSRVQWANCLCGSLAKQIEFVRPTGTIIVVMPHKSEGRSNGNEIVDDTLRSYDWRKCFAVDRSIRAQRTRQAWTSIKRETINIYRYASSPEIGES